MSERSTEDPLSMARRHVAEGEERIARQEILIAELDRTAMRNSRSRRYRYSLRLKPPFDWQNRSRNHGCLPSTGGTLVKRPGLDEAVMLPCATRTDKAGWPAPAHHRLPALILCSVKNRKPSLAEPLLKFAPCCAPSFQTRRNSRVFLICTML